MRKISIALVTVFALTMFLCTTAFAYYEKGEKIDNTNWSFTSLEIRTPDYHPSKINLDRNKKDPKLGPQLLTPEDIQNVALQVAKEDKLPFAVEPAPATTQVYATTTVANDSKIGIFVDVYTTKDNKWLYTFQAVNGGPNDDTVANYKLMYHKFFRALNLQMEANEKAMHKGK